MDSGWYALSDGSRKYWTGTEWLDAELQPALLDAVADPVAIDAPPPPVRSGQSATAVSGARQLLFALVAIGLVVGNAFFPLGLLQDPSWIWRRLTYLSPFELITPWYLGFHIRLIEFVLWWIGIIVAIVFTALRVRSGALAGIIIAAVPTAFAVVAYAIRIWQYQIWQWDVVSAVIYVLDIAAVAALMALAIVMVARLTPQPAVLSPDQPAAPGKTNSLATAALIASILTFWIVGIVLGHIALSQIKRSGEGGRNLALAAVIIGYIGWALGAIALIVLQQWWYSQY